MFEYFTKVGFSGSHGAKTHYGLVLFWARALQSSLFFYVFFHGVCKPCNEPRTSGDGTHKYHNTAILFITRFLYWTFLYLLCYILLSLIGIFFRYLFVLTYFDSSRRHTHATTHVTGTQIVRAKMTSLDAIFCRGNNSSSRSLARFYRRKNKKSKARAFRGNSDEASVSCPTTSSRNDATPPKIWPECPPQTWKGNASCWDPFTTAPEAHSWYTRVLWCPSSHGDGQSAFLRYKDLRP